MLSMPKVLELLVIFAILFLVFGPNKLPSLGKAIGESIKNFKKGLSDENTIKNNSELLAESASRQQAVPMPKSSDSESLKM